MDWSVNPFQPTSQETTPPQQLDDNKLFRQFVFEHINTALGDGFNDNIGRTSVAPVFELPNKTSWEKIYNALTDFFFGESPPKSSKIYSYFAQIKSHVDIDAQFSENRCKKVLPNALSLYQENLPAHYTNLQHQQRVRY